MIVRRVSGVNLLGLVAGVRAGAMVVCFVLRTHITGQPLPRASEEEDRRHQDGEEPERQRALPIG